MKKRIVIINGSGGVGKDTFIDFCRGYTWGVYNMSSIDKIKKAAEILGWTGEKGERGRKFLSDLKMLSTKYNDQPYEHIRQSIIRFNEEGSFSSFELMFIHIREPKEIERVKNNFGCITLFIKNPNVPAILTNDGDRGVDGYKYDFVINNDGTLSDLQQKAQEFMSKIFC